MWLIELGIIILVILVGIVNVIDIFRRHWPRPKKDCTDVKFRIRKIKKPQHLYDQTTKSRNIGERQTGQAKHVVG